MDNFIFWATGHHMTVVEAFSFAFSALAPNIVKQRNLTFGAGPPATFDELKAQIFTAVKDILGGGECVKEFHHMILKRGEEARDLWNRVENMARICYPAQIAMQRAKEQFIRCYSKTKIGDKIQDKLYQNPDIEPKDLVDYAQNQELRSKRKYDNNGELVPQRSPYQAEQKKKKFLYKKGSRRPGVGGIDMQKPEKKVTFQTEGSINKKTPAKKRKEWNKGSNKKTYPKEDKFGKSKGTSSNRLPVKTVGAIEQNTNTSSNAHTKTTEDGNVWTIGNTPVEPKFDSGADVSYIQKSVYKRIQDLCFEDEEDTTAITLANGAEIPCSRRVKFNLTNLKHGVVLEVEAWVGEGKGQRIFIGKTTMKKNRLLLDMGSDRFRIQNKWLAQPV